MQEVKMAHHRRKRPKNARAGCLLCHPHKINGARPVDQYRIGEVRRMGGKYHRFTERVDMDEVLDEHELGRRA